LVKSLSMPAFGCKNSTVQIFLSSFARNNAWRPSFPLISYVTSSKRTPPLCLFTKKPLTYKCMSPYFHTYVSKLVLLITNHLRQDKSILTKTGHKNHTIQCHATTNHAHQTQWLTAQAASCNPALDPRPVPSCVAASSKRDKRQVSLLNKDGACLTWWISRVIWKQERDCG
jgi:hypothetical protein